jgi:N-acetylmuramoyl-L-alanine amidase
VTIYQSRSSWTDEPRGGAQLTGSQLVGIACHWPGTTTDAYGVESASKVAARLRGWWDYHVNVRGWTDIGYNFAVDQAGRVWDLRGLARVGAHCASATNPDANHEWLGVLFILGDHERPSLEMIAAFQDFRFDVFLPRWPGRTRLTGHGRAPGVPGAQTDCPGPFVAAKLTDGTLAQPSGQISGDDMTPEQADQLSSIFRAVARLEGSGDGSGSIEWRTWNNGRGPKTRTMIGETLTIVKGLADHSGVDVDEQALAVALAPLLAPLLPTTVVDLDDEDLARIATAIADEQARRLAS